MIIIIIFNAKTQSVFRAMTWRPWGCSGSEEGDTPFRTVSFGPSSREAFQPHTPKSASPSPKQALLPLPRRQQVALTCPVALAHRLPPAVGTAPPCCSPDRRVSPIVSFLLCAFPTPAPTCRTWGCLCDACPLALGPQPSPPRASGILPPPHPRSSRMQSELPDPFQTPQRTGPSTQLTSALPALPLSCGPATSAPQIKLRIAGVPESGILGGIKARERGEKEMSAESGILKS